MTSWSLAKGRAAQRPVAIVVLGPSGLGTARRLKDALGNAAIHGLARQLSSDDVDHVFSETSVCLQTLFAAGHPLLVLSAAAIPIRLLAPLLKDKTEEPPVLAIAEDGSAVIPLLGGHHGANDLARLAGKALKTVPAITTAGDLRLGLALDQPPPGWTVANREAVKPLTSALLSGDNVHIDIAAGDADDAAWLNGLQTTQSVDAGHRILITDHAVSPPAGTLVYHPDTLALGIGCERGTEPEELIDLVESTIDAHGLARASIAAVVSISLKAAEPAVHALADHLGVPARFFSAEVLERERPRIANPSDLVFKETGCHGVAEGAALAAVSKSGALIVEKTKSRRATLAIARAESVLNTEKIGRPQGRLAIIGIGPGQKGWRSPEADELLACSDHWIGYLGYLNLLGSPGHAQLHGFPLGEEEDRARAAIELAAEGERVALISSGDAGIYAMASLVFELLDRGEDPAWERIDVTMTPGISALQAAAARVGAPLGHDFCAISLSDLLTPWPVIERRLQAAAKGDFVIALYNPASLRRRTGLARAIALLEAARPPSTPVVIAKSLGRDGEAIEIVTLEELDQDQVDMMSILIVGSSQTRMASRLHGSPYVYTPRGYLDHEARPEDRCSA